MVSPLVVAVRTRSGFGVGGLLAVAKDHELGGLHRSHADVADELPGVDLLLGHGGAVTAHEERLLGLQPHQGAALPYTGEEVGDAAPDLGPERLVVGLEDDPLDSLFD